MASAVNNQAHVVLQARPELLFTGRPLEWASETVSWPYRKTSGIRRVGPIVSPPEEHSETVSWPYQKTSGIRRVGPIVHSETPRRSA
jgi:hypothetical protein